MQNDMRDRLIELYKEATTLYFDYLDSIDEKGLTDTEGRAKFTIDHLIANGVILPICKIDDDVFFYTEWEKVIYCENVNKIFTETSQNSETIFRYETETLEFTNEDVGKTVFLTKDQAEQKLNELSGNA